MKKMMLTALAVLTASGIFAQAVPQPAFRLLDGYLEKRTVAAAYGAKAGPWALMGTGVALGVASATVWFAGDAIADAAKVGRMSDSTKFGTAVGLGIGAVVLAGVGLALHNFPVAEDERAQYSAIYHETDPVLQESLAAGRLKSLAETSKDSRIVSGWVNLALTGTYVAFQLNQNREKGLTWSEGIVDSWGWKLGSVVGGVHSLLVKSEEETLYEEYQAAVARLAKD